MPAQRGAIPLAVVPDKLGGLQVATRIQRQGLTFSGTAVASRAGSVTSTSKSIGFASFSSQFIPLLVRFRAATNGFRITTSTASTAFTSVAAAVWSDWEPVYSYYRNGGTFLLDAVTSTTGVMEYEVKVIDVVAATT